MKQARKVVVDTNFLVLGFQFGIDLVRELDRVVEERYELVVSEMVARELEMLAAGRRRGTPFARLALRLIHEKRVRVEKSEERVDDWIVGYARANSALACTNDRGLRERLRKARVRTIVMKGKTHLDFY